MNQLQSCSADRLSPQATFTARQSQPQSVAQRLKAEDSAAERAFSDLPAVPGVPGGQGCVQAVAGKLHAHCGTCIRPLQNGFAVASRRLALYLYHAIKSE